MLTFEGIERNFEVVVMDWESRATFFDFLELTRCARSLDFRTSSNCVRVYACMKIDEQNAVAMPDWTNALLCWPRVGKAVFQASPRA